MPQRQGQTLAAQMQGQQTQQAHRPQGHQLQGEVDGGATAERKEVMVLPCKHWMASHSGFFRLLSPAVLRLCWNKAMDGLCELENTRHVGPLLLLHYSLFLASASGSLPLVM